ncbi:MAG: RlmE family RNA methyltransferase [Alphaproteobacteria bacterium]
MKRPIGPRSKPDLSKIENTSQGLGQGQRNLAVKVKTAKRRKIASTQWLERQLNDPYVAEAKRLGYRGRAAFKLLELDERLKFLKPNSRIVDLGCAPGGWLQVMSNRCKSGQIVGIDLQEIEPVPGTLSVVGDVRDSDDMERIRDLLLGPVDAVVSDMAAASTGHSQTDHMRVMHLITISYEFARKVLRPGGLFLAKTLRGGSDNELLADLKLSFERVRHVKPKSSRDDSKETFLVCERFRGSNSEAG